MKNTNKIFLGETFYIEAFPNEVLFTNTDRTINEYVTYDINTPYEEIMTEIRVFVEKYMTPDALIIYDKWVFLSKITKGNVGKMYEKGVLYE